jgi:hypothetical protein
VGRVVTWTAWTVQGFPTIKIFGADKRKPTDYQVSHWSWFHAPPHNRGLCVTASGCHSSSQKKMAGTVLSS